MMETLRIEHPNDWQLARGLGLTTVVDPMVYRVAECFLAGRARAEDRAIGNADSIWDAGLGKNTDSLEAFFDALILTEQLPIFDYHLTFDGYFPTSSFASVINRAAADCSHAPDVLVPVQVAGEAYSRSKNAALAAYQDGRARLPSQLVAEIMGELSVFEYQWAPDLDHFAAGASEADLRLTRFALGFSLLGAYTQQLEGVQVAHGKRARLQLGASLRAPSVSHRVEGELYACLRKTAEELKDAMRIEYEVPEAPTFLPTLLRSDPKSPYGLLTSALKLRGSGAVSDYRKFRAEVLSTMAAGERPIEALVKLNRLAEAVRRELAPHSVKVETAVRLTPTGLLPEVKASTAPIPVGWLFDRLPGRRHHKLLVRAWADQARFGTLEIRLRQLWNAAPKM